MFKVAFITVSCLASTLGLSRSNGIELISVAINGTAANGVSLYPSIDESGSIVCFESGANDLTPDDENHFSEGFARDVERQVTIRLASITGPEFRSVRFPYASPNREQVFVQGNRHHRGNLILNGPNLWKLNLTTGRLECVSAPTGHYPNELGSFSPDASADGRFIVFSTDSKSFGFPDFNHVRDVYLRDMLTGRYEWISQTSLGFYGNNIDGSSHPQISEDGRFVVFDSDANGLVPEDRNDRYDVFLRDRKLGTTTLVSHVFGTRRPVGDSRKPSISADGRFVVFEAPNWISGIRQRRTNCDLYLYDRILEKYTCITNAAGGGGDNSSVFAAKICGNGSTVVFSSEFAFVPSDTNEVSDVYAYDVASRAVTLITKAWDGGNANANSTEPDISYDGKSICFSSWASNLAPEDDNGLVDVFLFKK